MCVKSILFICLYMCGCPVIDFFIHFSFILTGVTIFKAYIDLISFCIILHNLLKICFFTSLKNTFIYLQCFPLAKVVMVWNNTFVDYIFATCWVLACWTSMAAGQHILPLTLTGRKPKNNAVYCFSLQSSRCLDQTVKVSTAAVRR